MALMVRIQPIRDDFGDDISNSPGERVEAGRTLHCGLTRSLSRRSRSGERRRQILGLEVQGATRRRDRIAPTDGERSDGQLQTPTIGRFPHVVGGAPWGG